MALRAKPLGADVADAPSCGKLVCDGHGLGSGDRHAELRLKVLDEGLRGARHLRKGVPRVTALIFHSGIINIKR